MLIEIKNDQEVGEFESRVAQILTDYEGRFAVIAFNSYTLRWFKELNVPLLGYTIDDQEEYDQAKGYYDNLIVNTVDLK